MITIKHHGSFKNILRFLNKAEKADVYGILDKYGKIGVDILAAATPINSGKTAQSWTYEVNGAMGNYAITWSNTNINEGVNIALILQLGHGTGTGGYYQGTDYINPALRPLFDEILDEIESELSD